MDVARRGDPARVALLVGAALRLAAFPFAEDLWADAPIRGDIALAWARHPGLWWSYREVAQYGPLPAHLEGLCALLGLTPRLVPLLAGLAGLGLIARVARRLTGAQGAALATWSLALSPLHLQASTTCASEAIFLLCALGVLEGLLTRRAGLLALSAFAASTTRFDAWLWLPPLALLVWWRAQRTARGWWLGLSLALGPLSILLANALTLHRPLAPLQHISEEHTLLAQRLVALHGPLLARLRAVLFWPVAPLLVLTPGFGLLALRAVRRVRAAEAPAILALVPPGIYALRALLTGTFLPMLRLAAPPAQLLTVFAPPPSPRALRLAIGCAVAFDLALLGLAAFPNPLQEAARVATPLTRLPEELRAGVAALQVEGSAALDQSPGCEDIVIAHHAGRDRFALYAPATPPWRVVSIQGAPLDAQLARDGRAFGERCQRAGQSGRITWWDCQP